MTMFSLILANSDELVYVIAVVVLLGVGWLVQWFKDAVERTQQRNGGTPRRPPRPIVPPVRRPTIPPLPESHQQPARRPAVTPPRPTARPPVPVPEQRRPIAAPPRPVTPAAQGPMAPRTVEERKAVIRGEYTAPRPPGTGRPAQAPPRPQRAAPARPAQPPKPAVVVQIDDADAPRVRLAAWGGQPAPAAQPLSSFGGHMTSLKPHVETPHPADNVMAFSFRKLGRADLQRALVLKEILEPPLALRD